MTIAVANVELTDSFLVWINKFNQAATALREVVVTVGDPIVGDVIIQGGFSAVANTGASLLSLGTQGSPAPGAPSADLRTSTPGNFVFGGWNGVGYEGTLTLNFFGGYTLNGPTSIVGSLGVTGNISGTTASIGQITADSVESTTLRSSQSVGVEGGEVAYAAPASNTVLQSDVITDVQNSSWRLFSLVDGSPRGIQVDFANTVAGIHNLWTSSNLNFGTGLTYDPVTRTLTAGGGGSGSGVENGVLQFDEAGVVTISYTQSEAESYFDFAGINDLRLNGEIITVLPRVGNAGHILTWNGIDGYALVEPIVAPGTETGQTLVWNNTLGRYVPGEATSRWQVVAAGTTLAAGQRYLANLASNADFPLPASITPGDTFALHLAAGSGVTARIVVGAGRTVDGFAEGANLVIENNVTVSLVARTATYFDIVQAGAINATGGAAPHFLLLDRGII